MRRFVPSQTAASRADGAPPEDELDALLDKVEEKKAKKQAEVVEEAPDAVEAFRARLRQVLIPVFDELKDKYAVKGVKLHLDVDEFLGGGSSMKIRFDYGELFMELDGTVARSGVAFYIIRGIGQSKGAVLSGPMLRIRNLSPNDFRQFIVEHLSQLVKDALRQS